MMRLMRDEFADDSITNPYQPAFISSCQWSVTVMEGEYVVILMDGWRTGEAEVGRIVQKASMARQHQAGKYGLSMLKN